MKNYDVERKDYIRKKIRNKAEKILCKSQSLGDILARRDSELVGNGFALPPIGMALFSEPELYSVYSNARNEGLAKDFVYKFIDDSLKRQYALLRRLREFESQFR